MKNFIFFSKTLWNEPPRLRHQLARLLHNAGESVVFTEKPSLPFMKSSISECNSCENLKILKTKQLIHHQLRIFNFLQAVNNKYEISSIKKIVLPHSTSNSVIVNFNYDYGFLREIFPKNKILSIINDDFVAQAKLKKGSHTKKALAKTCNISNAVLTVSYPLMQQLSEWCKPTLFLPWSDHEYKHPSVFEKRDSILVWASISDVIDYDIIVELSVSFPELFIYLVGPISGNAKKIVPQICASHRNIIYFSPSSLEELPLNRFFASLMPYRREVRSTAAVTLANKSIRLMSRGLPLIVHGMPNFLEREAIFKCNNVSEIAEAINRCKRTFGEIQNEIRQFVNTNTSKHRLAEFMNIVG